MSTFWPFIVVEGMKIVRRPMTWILGVVIFGGVLLFNALLILVILAPEMSGVSVESESGETISRSEVVLPDGFIGNFGGFGLLASIGLTILAAGVVGSEFSWGTMRTMLQIQSSRARVLLAKVLALELITLFLVLISIPFTIGVTYLVGVVLRESVPAGAWMTSEFFSPLPLQALRMFIVVGMWVLIAITLTFITHSLTAGIAATLMLNFLGGTVASMIETFGDAGIWIARAIPNQAINAVLQLNNESQTLYSSADYPWIVASLVVWSGVLLLAAYMRFRSMNILEVSS